MSSVKESGVEEKIDCVDENAPKSTLALKDCASDVCDYLKNPGVQPLYVVDGEDMKYELRLDLNAMIIKMIGTLPNGRSVEKSPAPAMLRRLQIELTPESAEILNRYLQCNNVSVFPVAGEISECVGGINARCIGVLAECAPGKICTAKIGELLLELDKFSIRRGEGRGSYRYDLAEFDNENVFVILEKIFELLLKNDKNRMLLQSGNESEKSIAIRIDDDSAINGLALTLGELVGDGKALEGFFNVPLESGFGRFLVVSFNVDNGGIIVVKALPKNETVQ